jgi:DNA-binding NarL/FixJ family response regulator
MVRVCIADNLPVVVQGIKSYFKDNSQFEISSHASNLKDLLDALQLKKINILLMDIELEGISSIRDIKALIKDYPTTKIVIFSSVSEKMYAPTAIKAGVSAYVSKSSTLKELESILKKVTEGKTIFSDEVRKQIELLGRGKKKERLYKKLSTREIEVLRYLNDGKKNKEIAEILGLDEKTISTYKLRLLAKLSVTNLVDLLSKAKTLDII